MGNQRDIQQSSSEKKDLTLGDILDLHIQKKTEELSQKLLLRKDNPYTDCAQPAGCIYCGGIRCPYDTEPKPKSERIRPIIPRYD